MDTLYLGCTLLKISVVHYAMDIFGYFGHAVVGLPVSVSLIALGYTRHNRHLKLAGFAVLLSIASAGLLTEALKHLFQMPRPKSFGSYGFPSGHSGTAFALASALSVSFPALTPLYFFLATLTGISRMYFRAHFLVDVIVGGLAGGRAGFLITRRIVAPAQREPISLTRLMGWFAVGTVALTEMLFFYGVEKQIRAYRITQAAAQARVPAKIFFDFGTPQVRSVLGHGWSGDELWQDGKQSVVWAEGLSSELRAVFPAAVAYRWRLHLLPYSPKGPACHVAEIRVNQVAVVKLLLEQGWHWYEFDVPSGVIRTGKNDLQFLFNFSESPKSRGRSGDTRSLSVAFDVLEAVPHS